jgi:hypothetical protein
VVWWFGDLGQGGGNEDGESATAAPAAAAAAAADLDLDHAVCLFSETAWACEPSPQFCLLPGRLAFFLSFF